MTIRATISNSSILIEGADDLFESELNKALSYTDKAKQYQLKRMQRNRFSVSSQLYSRLSEEVEGSLLEKDGDVLSIPSGFSYLIDSSTVTISDNRCETGDVVSLPWANRSYAFQLRDYQEEALEKAVTVWRGVVNLATGLGKTKTAVGMIRRLKRKALIVCPNKSIAIQFKQELELAFGSTKVGFIGDGKYKPSTITVGIAQSVVNKIDKIKDMNLGLIIFDETHHTPANTFYAIAKQLGNVGRIYGLTATSYRSDGKDIYITAACGPVIVERDVSWGIKNGWLSQPYFIVRTVKTVGPDIKEDKLKNYKHHVLRCKEMNDRIIADASAFIKAGKQTLILVDQIEHGELISSTLQIPFANGKDGNSTDLVERFNDKTILGLVATDGVVGEGVDTKSVEVLVMANFTASKGPVIQAVGRALRKTADKNTAIILDYIPAGSTMLTRHAKQRISYYKEITSNIKIV